MRTGISITLKPADRRRLKALARDRNTPHKHVWRAEIVLLSADGVGTNEIMRRTGKSKTCVWRWQERFMEAGYDSLLHDKTRPSRIPPLGSGITERVVTLTQTAPPSEATHWTSAMMAKVVGISASSVQRIWRAHGLQPHRVKQFKLSTDPRFVDKLRDVVGLYVDPPAHAVVLSVDEKSQIQALDRTQPGLPMKKGRAGTMTHDATTAREAASLTASLRKLESLKTRADAELAFADKALAAAKTDQARARAEEQKQKATSKATELGAQLDTAKADAKSKFDAAAAAKDAAKATETRKADTAKAASEAKLALERVSVYITRATQKIYVRRNTHKQWPDGGEVFDATIEVPVTIRDPDRRIGTHVFTAMARGEAGLRWTAVTIDNGDDARDALDRISIPQDVLDRIAPTALPRSSIIVSDEPLSRETNYRTEFVAVLNNQPQGGFVTRRPTVAVPVASANYWGNSGFGFFFQPNWNSQPGNTQPRRGQYYQPMQQRWW